MVAGDFSTIGKLSYSKYQSLVQKLPDFKSMIEKCVQTYNDDGKRHILTMLKKIDFLKEGIPPVILNKLVYTIRCRQYDPGQLIFKPGDQMNTI